MSSALAPVILSEINNQKEAIGTLKLGLSSPGVGYIKCDGSTKQVADYPEFAQAMPKVATEASLVDVTNTRPLDVSTTTSVNMFANGERVFIQDGSSLYIVEQGIQLFTVSLPTTNTIEALTAYGTTLFARTASAVGKSTNNGETWTWSSSTYSGFPTQVVRGDFMGADYDSDTDTFVFVTALAVHKLQGTTFTTFTGHNPAGLVSFSNTTISYKDVLYDSDTETWYVVGGVQTTSVASSWVYFVIKSTDGAGTWTVAVQEKMSNGLGSGRGFSCIRKKDGLFYMLDDNTTIANYGKLYVTSDFVIVTSSMFSQAATTDATSSRLIEHENLLYVGYTASQRSLRYLNITEANHAPSWSMVSMGSAHVLAIRSDGTLWAWGTNSSGQLGIGDTTEQYRPQQIGSDSDWSYCNAGSHSSAAIKSNGTLWTWGSNANGQLGLGDTTNRTQPVLVPGGKTWSRVSMSSGTATASDTASDELFSLAIDNAGHIYATGEYPLTSTGLQVSGTPTSYTLIENSRTYRDVFAYNGTATTVLISAFAISTDNQLYSWGYNNTTAGFLGRGSTTTSQGIGLVGSSQTWSTIRANTGLRVLALTTTGELWAWGSNSHGSLGLGDLVTRTSPTRVGSASNWVAAGTYLLSSSTTVGASYAVNSSGELYYFGPLAYGVSLKNDYLTFNTTNVQTTPALVATGFPAVKFIDYAATLSAYGTTGAIDVTFLMQDSSGRLLGAGADRLLGNSTGYASFTSRPEYTCFNLSSSGSPLVLTVNSSFTATYARNSGGILYIDASRTGTATGWTRSRWRISEGTVSEELSQFGPQIAPSVLCATETGESIYRQVYGVVDYYADANGTSGEPITLNYRTLENVLTRYYGYEPSITYATKQGFIYGSVDGINWSIVGRNPLRGTGNAVGPVHFNDKYWVSGATGGGIFFSSDLYRWGYVDATISLLIPQIAKNSHSMLFVTSTTSCRVMSAGSDSITTVTLPAIAQAGTVAASDTAWIYVSSTGVVYRSGVSVLSTGVTWATIDILQGSTSISYRDGIWFAGNATSIFYSVDDGVNWLSAQIDSSNLGYISMSAGGFSSGNGITGVATNDDSILLSENGIQWRRYKKPSEVTANSFTSVVAAPDGTMLLDDNTNFRTLLLTPGPADETRFVLPSLRTPEGISYYVKAK
jgi:hypothetical protein